MEGDGIGPEIVKEGIKVLEEIAKKFNHTFEYKYVDVGG
ncbi:isocitrate/isopropylmalate family dehydrogenase, partial [Desulfurella multipotens]